MQMIRTELELHTEPTLDRNQRYQEEQVIKKNN